MSDNKTALYLYLDNAEQHFESISVDGFPFFRGNGNETISVKITNSDKEQWNVEEMEEKVFYVVKVLYSFDKIYSKTNGVYYNNRIHLRISEKRGSDAKF